MREQLISYVNLLFAGNPEAEEIKQEILQNTLDRYDDLVAEGKNPQAAYSLAIAGIGDVSELLNGSVAPAEPQKTEAPEAPADSRKRRGLRALAVALYILCPVPVIILGHTRFEDLVGVPVMFLFIAAATAIMIMTARGGKEHAAAVTPARKQRDSIGSIVWLTATAVYCIVSFLTHAWFITWLIFIIAAAVNGLIHAIFDLKEAKNNENKCNY